MNRQEALDIFKCLAWHDLRPSEEEIEMAFKVLSDNSILEDIKAKISDMYPKYIDEKGYRMVRKSDALNIIDYYMGKRG